MPMLTSIRGVVGSGVIGEPKTLTANLGYVIDQVPRLKDPALAGGALLDVGIYPLNFALMIFGYNIGRISSSCTYTETGVDEQNSITLQYLDGKVAHLNSSMVSLSDRKGIIYGTKGYIIVENINNFESISVYDTSYKRVGIYKCPKQISGYEYEVEASIRAIRSRQIECEQMPHSETIRVMKIMDTLRKEWGIVYPFEKTQDAALEDTDKPGNSDNETGAEKDAGIAVEMNTEGADSKENAGKIENIQDTGNGQVQ